VITGKIAALKTVIVIVAIYLGFWTFFDVVRRALLGSSPSPLSLLGEHIANGLVIVYLVQWIGQRYSISLSEMGLKFRTTWVGLGVGGLVGVTLVLITGILSDVIKLMISWSGTIPHDHHFVTLQRNTYDVWHGSLLVLLEAITVVLEEVFFRGIIYSLLRQAFSVLPTLLISSGIFALFHIYPELITPMFFVGCALSLLRQWSKSLIEPIIAHATLNYSVFMFS